MSTSIFANPRRPDIVSTTYENMRKYNSDQLTYNNAPLREMMRSGTVEMFSGGRSLTETILYDGGVGGSNAQSYSGAEILNSNPIQTQSSAEFPICQYASLFTMSGLDGLQNAGPQEQVSLLASRIKICNSTLRNKISGDIFKNGTGNNFKDIMGLSAILPIPANAPVADKLYIQLINSGNYGGIDRSKWGFWQSPAILATKSFDGTGTNTNDPFITNQNILQAMNMLSLRLVRDMDRPNLILAGEYMYATFMNAMQTIQRITDDVNGTSGYSELAYNGAGSNCKVVLGGGMTFAQDAAKFAAAAAGTAFATSYGQENSYTMYFLNTKYLHFRVHSARNFVMLGRKEASLQDAYINTLAWAGNLTCSGAAFQGLIYSPPGAYAAPILN